MLCTQPPESASVLRSGICGSLVFTLTIAMTMIVFGEDKEKEDSKPAVPPAPAAPDPQLLQGVLRDLLRGPQPRVPMGRRGMPMNIQGQFGNDRLKAAGPSQDNDQTLHDLVDSRAPRDAKVELLLQAAELSISQKNWTPAVDLLQRLLDQPEDSLHRLRNGQWESIHSSANQMLGQLPQEILAEYQSRFGGLAQQQLSVARRTGLTADYVNVATRFFHTSAGYEAAYYLASQHFDRSEFGLAARWFSELARSSAPMTRSDSWLLQASLALTLAGDPDGAKTLLERLSQGPNTIVALETRPVKASEWLSQQKSDNHPGGVALSDWIQFYGTAARTGTSVGGDPLLAPNWSLPLTTSHIVQNSVKWLIHDLQDQQRAMILAAVPLAVDGKIIYRDLRGVRCVDAQTGRTTWESIEGASPERILGGLPSQQIEPHDGLRVPINPFLNSGEYQGLSAEYSPLANLIFRDGTYGLISSDGKQLFVIEDQGILSRNQAGQHWGWDGSTDPQDPFGMSWKTNRLVAYSLKSGRTLWSLGGIESKETFDLPLAGSYIYGTPAVEGNELFLVAGKGDDIRLWTLDRQTGQPKWSQLIAYSDTKIDQDLARRWITSQVAVGSGVVVCPTNVGWLVAVDRMRQVVLWAHRYAARELANGPDRDVGTPFLPQRELNAHWCPSTPVISGRYVVFTPQDEPLIICLNVVDGRRIWEQPKQRGLYLAGVVEQNVIIVGETNVIAYDLATGQPAWTSTFEEGVRPSGRGVVVGDHFYLPLSNGELQSIHLGTGKLISQTFVDARQPALGNLVMHRGKLVSLAPTGLTCFGQRDAILTEIQQRLARNADDPWALLHSSEIHLLNHAYTEALPLLRRISEERLTEDEKSRRHRGLIECLSTLVHTDILNHLNELEELGRLASTSAERLLYHELTAERLLAERRPVEAFDVLAKLAEDDSDTYISRSDDRHVSVKRIIWLSGRMSEIWSTTSEAQRALIDARINALVAQKSEQSATACYQIATLFAFHSAASVAQRRFVEWLIDANDLGGARIQLQQLAEGADRSVAARAIERLARLMIQSKLPADAVHYYRLLETRYADVVIFDNQTGAQFAESVRKAGALNFEQQERGVMWKSTPLQIEQSMVSYAQPSQDITHESTLPYFDQLSIECYQNEQRMALESGATGRMEWMVPLRGNVRSIDDGYLAMNDIGHQLFFVNRGVIHAVSPIEKRILWTRSLEEDDDGSFQGRHSSRPVLNPMVGPAGDDSSQSLLLQRAYTSSQLAIVESGYLCVYGRRSLSILDPRTGDGLWRHDSLPTNAQVVGTRDAVFVIVPGKSDVQAFRARDGKPLEVPDAAKWLNCAMLAHGSSLLLLEQGSASPLFKLGIRQSEAPKTVLRLHDPVANLTHWQLEFPPGTVVSPLDRDEIVAVQPDGQAQTIDIASGHIELLESLELPKPPRRRAILPTEKYLLADADRIYLIVNSQESGSSQYGESLSSIRVHGTIYAWNRQTHQFAWPHPVTMRQQNLVIDRFANMPVLLMISRSLRPRGIASVGTLSICAIHKQTGKVLVESKFPSAFNSIHAININSEGPSIDLKSYNLRMRLMPTEVSDAAKSDPQPLKEPAPK